MAKQVESFTMFLKVTNAQAADPDDWVITRVGCDHVIGDTVAAGATYPKTAECASSVLDGTAKGAKDTAGTVLKYAQDTKTAIETAESIS